MEIAHLRVRIEPRSAFGTPLKGDTIFGQLCWGIANRCGEGKLVELLDGYVEGRPFAVVSDAFPAQYWPRPELPPRTLGDIDPKMRKEVKKRIWLHHSEFDVPVGDWLQRMVATPQDVGKAADESSGWVEISGKFVEYGTRFRNSIDRGTGTTGEGLDPYGSDEFRYRRGVRLDCHIVYDADRIDPGVLQAAMRDIGAFGFGRDASVGLGRFDVLELGENDSAPGLSAQEGANAWLTLAPVAPQGMGFDPDRSWYRPFTRFGRHGDRAVSLGQPFKAPVLLADTAAVLAPSEGSFESRPFVGQGLGGGRAPISRALPETVHQGYAPVLGIRVPDHAPKDRMGVR